jgi:hypothetical protein
MWSCQDPSDAPTSAPAPERNSAGKLRAKAGLDRPASPPGWYTSDEHEITLRRRRGRKEILSVKARKPGHPGFGRFRAHSVSGTSDEVEIRRLAEQTNSCRGVDHRVNGLGTCKHIDGVIAAMLHGWTKGFTPQDDG